MVSPTRFLEKKFRTVNKTSVERIQASTQDYEDHWNSLTAKERLIFENKVKIEMPTVSRLRVLPQFASMISPIQPASQRRVEDRTELDLGCLVKRVKRDKKILKKRQPPTEALFAKDEASSSSSAGRNQDPDDYKPKLLAKLPKKAVDPALKGREKRLAELAAAEHWQRDFNARHLLEVDWTLRGEIKALAIAAPNLDQKIAKEKFRDNVRKLARRLARQRSLCADDIESSTSSEGEDVLAALAGKGAQRLQEFVDKLLRPPTPGRKATPPDARKRRFLKSHAESKDLRRNISKHFGAVDRPFLTEKAALGCATHRQASKAKQKQIKKTLGVFQNVHTRLGALHRVPAEIRNNPDLLR